MALVNPVVLITVIFDAISNKLKKRKMSNTYKNVFDKKACIL